MLGDAGAQAVSEKAAGLVNRVERAVWRYLPELGFGTSSSPTSSNQQD